MDKIGTMNCSFAQDDMGPLRKGVTEGGFFDGVIIVTIVRNGPES
jgi:hypothetical protein